MTKDQIEEVLRKHQEWLKNSTQGACADLRNADLRNADLRDADLRSANLTPFQLVPEIGQFHGFKKVRDGFVLELLIPKSAKRTSSLVGRKCRASKVKVLRVALDTQHDRRTVVSTTKFSSLHDQNFTYEVGKWSSVADFNGDIRVECTSGIHFFITLAEAKAYT